MLSDSSLIRVVLIDQNGNHFLVFETYPLITLNNTFSFNEVCNETCFLDGISPDSIRIDIINATLTLKSISYSYDYIDNAIQLQAQVKWSSEGFFQLFKFFAFIFKSCEGPSLLLCSNVQICRTNDIVPTSIL